MSHSYRHRQMVERVYNELLVDVQRLDDWYDAIMKEVEYHDVDDTLYSHEPEGEMDVCLIDWDDMEMAYIEIKAGGLMEKARRQIERARETVERTTPYSFEGAIATPDTPRFEVGGRTYELVE